MNILIKKLPDNKWAAYSGTKIHLNTISSTKRGAQIARLHSIGQTAWAVILECNRKLKKLKALNLQDPTDYLI